eukprot:XP_001696511.1 predicted protein [Chlamydomonas reinhardtii]
MKDLGPLSRALGEDREVLTLDVDKQAPGPKWTLRQWCLYWRERQPVGDLTALPHQQHPQQQHHHPQQQQHGGGGGGGRGGSEGAGHGSAAAAISSQDDGVDTEMDDEADSAFVHQG